MPDFTNGISTADDALDPFTAFLRQIDAKITNRKEGYHSKALMEWCDRFGGLTVYRFSGSQPVIVVPEPDDCPAILLEGAPSPELDQPYARLGPREFSYTVNVQGWIYTQDQEEANRFAWLFLLAIGSPYLSGFDLLYGDSRVPFLHKYWPGAFSFTPWSRNGDRLDAFFWSVPLNATFQAKLFV